MQLTDADRCSTCGGEGMLTRDVIINGDHDTEETECGTCYGTGVNSLRAAGDVLRVQLKLIENLERERTELTARFVRTREVLEQLLDLDQRGKLHRDPLDTDQVFAHARAVWAQGGVK